MYKNNKILALICVMVLCLTALSGCGDSGVKQVGNGATMQEAIPDSRLTSSDQHLVYITLNEENFPLEYSKVRITVPEDKKGEQAQELTYNAELGGYTVFLDEGEYYFDVVYDNKRRCSRYLIVDGEHSYYHVRFEEWTK